DWLPLAQRAGGVVLRVAVEVATAARAACRAAVGIAVEGLVARPAAGNRPVGRAGRGEPVVAAVGRPFVLPRAVAVQEGGLGVAVGSRARAAGAGRTAGDGAVHRESRDVYRI